MAPTLSPLIKAASFWAVAGNSQHPTRVSTWGAFPREAHRLSPCFLLTTPCERGIEFMRLVTLEAGTGASLSPVPLLSASLSSGGVNVLQAALCHVPGTCWGAGSGIIQLCHEVDRQISNSVVQYLQAHLTRDLKPCPQTSLISLNWFQTQVKRRSVIYWVSETHSPSGHPSYFERMMEDVSFF